MISHKMGFYHANNTLQFVLTVPVDVVPVLVLPVDVVPVVPVVPICSVNLEFYKTLFPV